MFKNVGYNRDHVLAYAQKWALSRNPRYLNFDPLGGDCTNFASQCIYAGCKVMNHTKTVGWYYNSPSDRAAAWTGVKYLYNFLTNNNVKSNSPGPYAEEIMADRAQAGDIIQLGDDMGDFYHSLVVTRKDTSEIYVATHTIDSFMRPLDSYLYSRIRCLHIVDCRKWV